MPKPITQTERNAAKKEVLTHLMSVRQYADKVRGDMWQKGAKGKARHFRLVRDYLREAEDYLRGWC